MKIQVDLDAELWGRFKDKVTTQGKTLKEVVPGVLEPALKAYIEPMQCVSLGGADSPELPIVDRITPLKHVPPPQPTRRCELCDNPTERLFASGVYKVCYACWKAAITAIPVPPPPTEPEAA